MTIAITFAAGQTDYVDKLNQLIAAINATAPGATWSAPGMLTKSVAGNSTVTLSSAECFNQILNLTGLLTGNINVTVPAAVGTFFIVNNSTGAYTITVKTPAGSGVIVVQGAAALVACDGTNVFNPLSSIAGTFQCVPSADAMVGASLGNSHATGYGVKIRGASDNTRYALRVLNADDSATFFTILGDGSTSGVPSLNGGVAWTVGNSHATGYGLKVRGGSDNTRYALTVNSADDGTIFWKIMGDSHQLPGVDNASNFGSAGLRVKELFCANGTINTSDAREKTAVAALDKAEMKAAMLLARAIGSFRFLDAVAEKGDSARRHIGITVQRAIEIMKECGLDPFAYAFICHDVWDDLYADHAAEMEVPEPSQLALVDAGGNVLEPARDPVVKRAAWREQIQKAGDRYSFRVHELLLFIARGQEARLTALEAAAGLA